MHINKMEGKIKTEMFDLLNGIASLLMYYCSTTSNKNVFVNEISMVWTFAYSIIIIIYFMPYIICVNIV